MLLGVCGIVLLSAGLHLFLASHVDPEELILAESSRYTDRHGVLLRHLPDAAGVRSRWTPREEIPDLVRHAFLAAEDERFYEHVGFDPAAIVRAMKDNLGSGRIVSGASTITQQLARLTYPRRRTYHDKLVEIFRAIRIEMALTKEEILTCYLNRVPMGNNLRGVGLAAELYFGRQLSGLTPAEAATLASLPKAPGALNPYGKGRERLLRRKDWVLSRMEEAGYLSKVQRESAASEEIAFRTLAFPFAAPHLVDQLLERAGAERPIGLFETSIDLDLQKGVEEILVSHRERLRYRGAFQASALVVDNASMEVLASVGSLAYAAENGGFNNGTVALRSPGSTLKPFVYGLALDSGYTVASLLQDTLRKYRTPKGDYAPLNYDRREYGPVTMRVALANSLNISAIAMLQELGLSPFYALLRQLRLINHAERGPDHYGLGLVLGNPEVTLEQLATAYAILANGGVYRPLAYSPVDKEPIGTKALSPETTYILSDILSDPSARTITFGNSEALSFPFRVALKTGTSTRYRDAWIAGYTPEYTVAVWAGNFEGNGTFSLSGATGAGPIFKEIMLMLHGKKPPGTFRRPQDVVEARVCGMSGMVPTANCDYAMKELFIRGTEPEENCSFHQQPGHWHELPASYAGWVYDKKRAGGSGGYRLKGMKGMMTYGQADGRVDAPLSPVSALRIRGEMAAGTEGEVTVSESGEGHRKGMIQGPLTIGDPFEAPPQPVGEAAQIIYPLPGDRFVLGGGTVPEQQAIRFEAVSQVFLEYVDWYVDGRHYARTGPPYSTFWAPRRGRHRISAVTPGHVGTSVEISVE